MPWAKRTCKTCGREWEPKSRNDGESCRGCEYKSRIPSVGVSTQTLIQKSIPGNSVDLHSEDTDLESESNSKLRAALASALRQLQSAKASKEELVAAVKKAAGEAIQAMQLPAIVPPSEDDRQDTPEVAIAVLSDWQLAKVTPSYNSEICERRIEEYADKVEKLTAIQRTHHPVRELRVYLLGDIVEGELIFPGQSFRIDASLFRQVCVDGPRILSGFLRRMLTVFDSVHVVGVIGNHGSFGPLRREYHPESNADSMLYEIVRMIMAGEPRLTWAPTYVDGERRWYAVDEVGQHAFLLFHGDQIKGGFAGFPWYGFDRKVKGWSMGAIPERFDYAVSGHFHTPVRMLIGDVRLWGNGSTESENTYASERLAAQGRPSQWLLYLHGEQGVTAEYEVHLHHALPPPRRQR